ncbi:hypothetical protein BCV69DRAFT_297775 [Microstroma glucosiphilum]|uniref:DUF7924 domain-containing protein n=1 Tax=Pseudomicrostroma glucosiphilum TaxID=1684307 RepID=A0A316UB91_9BASI|nr:hypothetical protein BCV69DRAFT_297775 [Pseudomicrostroma glucosiphilum]PWN22487.1 hypothetical protein BCV69DRAFT_297775 [Pseudomicrostroma glucosiphilum]
MSTDPESSSGRQNSGPLNVALSDSSMRSSEPSEEMQSVSYRKLNLRSAEIFVTKLQREQWPDHIKDVADQLTRNLVSETARITNKESSSSLSPREVAERDTAAALAHEVAQCNLLPEPHWISLNWRVFSVFREEELFSSLSQRFEVPIGPVSYGDWHLSTPKPDITIGLATDEHCAFGLSTAQARVLSQKFLSDLMALRDIHPFIAPVCTELVFPCLISVTKDYSGSLYAAENQAAHGAAKALAMVQSLRDSYLRGPDTQVTPRLPTIVICSQGCLFEVLVAFDVRREELPLQQGPVADSTRSVVNPGVHLVRVWVGAADELETMYQFQLLLQRIKRWILDTWRPTVLGMLEAVKTSMIEEEAEEEMVSYTSSTS